MAGQMVAETHDAPRLVTSREPVGPRAPGDKGSAGDRALMDGILIIGIAWAILFLLIWSLRSHNV